MLDANFFEVILVKTRVTLATCFFAFSTLATSALAGESGCAQQLDEQMREMQAMVSGYAGSVTYKKLMDRAMQCMNSGTCGKADLLIGAQEIMLDETVIGLQREKLAVLKKFLVQQKTKPNSNDPCELMRSFPPVLEQIKALNEKQIEKFQELSSSMFMPIGGQSK
ncbi:hypothetical protein [Massilia rubra]|uniref:Uncharacterized protein n=1 Tax=Massilia rubra TaxID=2607910 RepID=A0ABX0LKH8_9BURK|nr:hypothetical protein [Massilia rubra]NHZ34700.1 hypothetical protein [Massilia rubra]